MILFFHLSTYCDMMWLALLILFNYLLYYYLFIFYLYFIYISFIFHLYFIHIFIYLYIYIFIYLYIYIFIYLYIYHPLCAYTISRFGFTVPHALMDHIESCLRNHVLPAPDAEHFTETEGVYREVSCDRLFNVDFLTGIPPNTVLSSTHIFIRSHKWYHGRSDTSTKASGTPFTKFCWTWSEWKKGEACLVS